MNPRSPKQVVRDGYNGISPAYTAQACTEREAERGRYLGWVLGNVAAGSDVLDLGRGAGLPMTARLAESFNVTGADISERQTQMARHNVPAARFILSDMLALDLPPDRFDAVTAFFSVIHLPRHEHASLLSLIRRWLRPGGLLVATMGARATEGYEEDYMGAPMYWSHFDGETNRRMVRGCGLALVREQEETALEDGEPVTFQWIIARKP